MVLSPPRPSEGRNSCEPTDALRRKDAFCPGRAGSRARLNDTYEIDAHIASGGMGEVYRGHNIETGEPVAIKAVRPEFAEDETILALFKKEATVLGRLRHDTIVRYYSFSRIRRSACLIWRWSSFKGNPSRIAIAAGPLDRREAALLFIRVAEGLAVAHRGRHRPSRPVSRQHHPEQWRRASPAHHRFRHCPHRATGDRTLIGSISRASTTSSRRSNSACSAATLRRGRTSTAWPW